MTAYICNNDSIEGLVALAKSQTELDLDDFDNGVRPATASIISHPDLNYFVEAYTNILDDHGIEFVLDSTTEALDTATGGACAWFSVPGSKAASFLTKIERVTITPEKATSYLGPVDDDPRLMQSLHALHREFTEILRQVRPSQTVFFRADL